MKQYTFEELNQMRITKGELFALLKSEGVEFDYALPENWVDALHAFCEVHNPLITYHLIVSTTVWVYLPKGDYFGGPCTACKEVQEAINAWQAK